MTQQKSEKSNDDQPFRFYDNREKYLLFVTTTSEKSVVARRIGQELERIRPKPPALRLFDAGTGNGEVLANVMRQMHCKFPTVPFFVAGKEISMEDARLTLSQFADRLAEHPQTVIVLTNMFYAEAPWLFPRSAKNQAKMKWWNVPLKGHSAHEFGEQIEALDDILSEGWQTISSKKTGNPVYKNPSVVVLYREDHEFVMSDIIPKNTGGKQRADYDFILAAQPYRSRQTAEFKGQKVLAPLARSLGTDGRMVVVQSTGHDPGMEIIRKIWPQEEPFATPRHLLIRELDRQLNGENGERQDDPDFVFDGYSDDRALFTYHLHSMPNEVSSNISTSTMLAAWNAAVYVAQIEDERINEQLQSGNYLDATVEVVRKHGGLWFQDESFVVVKKK